MYVHSWGVSYLSLFLYYLPTYLLIHILLETNFTRLEGDLHPSKPYLVFDSRQQHLTASSIKHPYF